MTHREMANVLKNAQELLAAGDRSGATQLLDTVRAELLHRAVVADEQVKGQATGGSEHGLGITMRTVSLAEDVVVPVHAVPARANSLGNLTVLDKEAYDELPGADGEWIGYLRSRLYVGFLGMSRDSKERRWQACRLVYPTGGHWAEDLNLWRRGHQWYCQARLCRVERRDRGLFDLELTGKAPDLQDLLQRHEVGRLVQRSFDPITLDRFIGAGMHYAIEGVLKAMKAHTLLREGMCPSWLDTHSLDDLFNDLPETLQKQIRTEADTFGKIVDETRTRRRHLADVLPPRPALKDGTYTNDDLAFFGTASMKWLMDVKRILPDDRLCLFDHDARTYGAGWFDEELKKTTRVELDRYGPTNDAPDQYPLENMWANYNLAWFFYEYLFPFSLARAGLTSGLP